MADYMGGIFGAVAQVYAEGEMRWGSLAMQAVFLCLGLVVFSIISGSLYLKLSRREIFKVDIHNSIFGGTEGAKLAFESFIFILKYTLIFPLITFLWIAVLTIFISAISRNLSVENIAVISLAIVAATRIVSYYSEEIAVDLSKLLPVVLLGVALTDPTAISAAAIIERGYALAAIAGKFVPVFTALIVLEWALRIALIIKRKLFDGKESQKNAIDEEEDIIIKEYLKEKISKKK